MKPLTTSLVYNDALEYFRGFSFRAITHGIIGLIVGGLLVAQIGFSIPGLGPLLTVAIGYFAFSATSKAMGGTYPYQNWERFVLKMSSLISKESTLNLGQHVNLFHDQDLDRLILGFSGTQISAYRIDFEDEKTLQIDLAYLLKRLPSGCRLQFLRVATKSANKQESLRFTNSCQLYVVLEFRLQRFPGNTWQKEASKILNRLGTQLSSEESTQLLKRIVYPGADHSWEDTSSFFKSPITIMREQALAHVGEIEKRSMVICLAKLPEKVGPNFQKVYGVLNRLPGTISVKFQGIGQQNAFIGLLNHRKISKSGRQSVDTKPQERISTSLTLQAIVHGTQEELEGLSEDLSREFAYLPSDEKPTFIQENAYLKQALSNLLPGQPLHIQRRQMLIFNAQEAVSYIPMPLNSGHKSPLIPMRTAQNSIFGFEPSLNHPLYIWAGVGQGKSALMSKILINHIARGRRGPRTASFSFEAGGTFKFLRYGLADFVLSLDHENGNYLPLSHQPLRVLFSFEQKGFDAAHEWILKLANINPNEAVLSDLVLDALKQCQKENLFMLKDVYSLLSKNISQRFQTVPADHPAPTCLAKLKNFCAVDGSKYGHIFDPETSTTSCDYENLNHFYVAQMEAAKVAPELMSAFFSLGTYLLVAVEHKFMPGSKTSATLLVQIDEMHHLADTIGWDTLRQLNSQGRKQRKLLTSASQSLSDSVKEGSDQNRFEFIESFGHFLFAGGIADSNHLLAAMGIKSDDGSIWREFETTLEHLQELRRRDKGYAWGYIDPDQKFHVLMVDLEQTEKWLCASHAASQHLRDRVIKEGGYDYWTACELLAIYGPKTLPVDKDPPETQVQKMFERMWRHG